METSRVAPLLLDPRVKDIPEPLTQFQCTLFEKEDVRKLVHSINRASSEQIDLRVLDGVFENGWPALEQSIAAARAAEFRVRVAPPAEGLVEGGLPKEQVAILKTLAATPGANPTAGMMARAIKENETRTEYHLDRLKERRLVSPRYIVGAATTWSLAAAGRKYLVENDLV